MSRWTVEREGSRFDGRPGAADVAYGFNVHLEGPGKQKIVVWYANGETAAVSPREAVRPYLDDVDPPEHLLVHRNGVSVVGRSAE
jgi:hypothetical protein